MLRLEEETSSKRGFETNIDKTIYMSNVEEDEIYIRDRKLGESKRAKQKGLCC
mgnify:CR=1 FL=1